jgi:ABC-type branched-subunit amino acid transport system ATPase component
MPEQILEVRDLRKTFGDLRAVDGCTFSVEEATITGLIGPNGAGKSTVIDLISGFTRADSGSVTFAGDELMGRPPHQIAGKRLIRTFQQARGWAHLTVLENLLVAAPPGPRESLWRPFLTPRVLRTAERADRVRARELLDEFGLLHMKNAPVHTLSGGQRRLLEVARIMMARPRMVILDEPVASVNPVMTESIARSIKRLPEHGVTVLLVEHNLGFVAETCSTVIVMALGKVIAQATMDQLQEHEAVVDAYLGDLRAAAV